MPRFALILVLSETVLVLSETVLVLDRSGRFEYEYRPVN